MSVNKSLDHVYVIPKDRANEEIANGFLLHDQVDECRIQVSSNARGWTGVLKVFETEYIPRLNANAKEYVILLVDFDGKFSKRYQQISESIPGNLKDQGFVLGSKDEPERLKKLFKKAFLEDIGTALAEECYQDSLVLWGHEHLMHNETERLRIARLLKPFLFLQSRIE